MPLALQSTEQSIIHHHNSDSNNSTTYSSAESQYKFEENTPCALPCLAVTQENNNNNNNSQFPAAANPPSSSLSSSSSSSSSPRRGVPLSSIVSVLVSEWSRAYTVGALQGDIESMCMISQAHYSKNGWGCIPHDTQRGAEWLYRAKKAVNDNAVKDAKRCAAAAATSRARILDRAAREAADLEKDILLENVFEVDELATLDEAATMMIPTTASDSSCTTASSSSSSSTDCVLSTLPDTSASSLILDNGSLSSGSLVSHEDGTINNHDLLQDAMHAANVYNHGGVDSDGSGSTCNSVTDDSHSSSSSASSSLCMSAVSVDHAHSTLSS